MQSADETQSDHVYVDIALCQRLTTLLCDPSYCKRMLFMCFWTERNWIVGGSQEPRAGVLELGQRQRVKQHRVSGSGHRHTGLPRREGSQDRAVGHQRVLHSHAPLLPQTRHLCLPPWEPGGGQGKGIVWEHIRETSSNWCISSGNARPQSSQLTEPLLTGPGLKSGISTRELIMILNKKHKQEMIRWTLPRKRRGSSSVGRAVDRHAPPSQLWVQTLLRCPCSPVCNRMHYHLCAW